MKTGYPCTNVQPLCKRTCTPVQIPRYSPLKGGVCTHPPPYSRGTVPGTNRSDRTKETNP